MSLLTLTFFGCKQDPPSKSLIKKKITEYLQSINLPLEIEEIHISFNKYIETSKYHSIEINVKGKIYSEDKKKVLYEFDNNYNSKFYNMLYGYWWKSFSLKKYPPPDSVIYSLSSENFGITPETKSKF